MNPTGSGRPLAIDLYCGLGGWTEGLLAEGYDVIGFDNERHEYGEHRYPAQLVLQDVLTLHGGQFRDVDLIVGSSPCQEFSYRAMPWKRAKALGPPELGMRLFNAQFRIQREASAAAGRHIPMVVENVKGAQKWVGRARWHHGSYYLWGDVPALMPMTRVAFKSTGLNWSDRTKKGQDFTRRAGDFAIKNAGGSWFLRAHNTGSPHNPVKERQDPRDRIALTAHATNPDEDRGVKHQASGAAWFDSGPAAFPSGSSRRKAASALIAKIPLALSRHIARTYLPSDKGQAA